MREEHASSEQKAVKRKSNNFPRPFFVDTILQVDIWQDGRSAQKGLYNGRLYISASVIDRLCAKQLQNSCAMEKYRAILKDQPAVGWRASQMHGYGVIVKQRNSSHNVGRLGMLGVKIFLPAITQFSYAQGK